MSFKKNYDLLFFAEHKRRLCITQANKTTKTFLKISPF